MLFVDRIFGKSRFQWLIKFLIHVSVLIFLLKWWVISYKRILVWRLLLNHNVLITVGPSIAKLILALVLQTKRLSSDLCPRFIICDIVGRIALFPKRCFSNWLGFKWLISNLVCGDFVDVLTLNHIAELWRNIPLVATFRLLDYHFLR